MPKQETMKPLQNIQHVADQTADAAATISVAAAGGTWLVQANEVLTLIATTIAIVSGTLAIIWHVRRLRGKNDESNKD